MSTVIKIKHKCKTSISRFLKTMGKATPCPFYQQWERNLIPFPSAKITKQTPKQCVDSPLSYSFFLSFSNFTAITANLNHHTVLFFFTLNFCLILQILPSTAYSKSVTIDNTHLVLSYNNFIQKTRPKGIRNQTKNGLITFILFREG